MKYMPRRKLIATLPFMGLGMSALSMFGCGKNTEEAGERSSSGPRDLRIMVFPGGFNLPLWAAQENGFFKRRNINLIISETRSSVQQVSELMNSEQDVILTAMDNVIAYQEDQGATQFDRPTDLFSFMGGDNAFLSLVVQKDIQSYDDLRGKTLSVDALNTGFAFVLKQMLAMGGLREKDYTLVSAGGVTQRWRKLVAGEHAGTLVLTPFDVMAGENQLRVLQRAVDVIPDYQGIVGAARRSWAEANTELLISFIAGYLDGLDWLYAEKNREEAESLFSEKLPNLPAPTTQKALDIFLAENGGFDPMAKISMRGVGQVMKIRNLFSTPPKQLDDPYRYIDFSYYEKAVASR